MKTNIEPVSAERRAPAAALADRAKGTPAASGRGGTSTRPGDMQSLIDSSPRMLAQKRAIDAMRGPVASHQGPAQLKTGVVQRAPGDFIRSRNIRTLQEAIDFILAADASKSHHVHALIVDWNTVVDDEAQQISYEVMHEYELRTGVDLDLFDPSGGGDDEAQASVEEDDDSEPIEDYVFKLNNEGHIQLHLQDDPSKTRHGIFSVSWGEVHNLIKYAVYCINTQRNIVAKEKRRQGSPTAHVIDVGLAVGVEGGNGRARGAECRYLHVHVNLKKGKVRSVENAFPSSSTDMKH